MATWGGVLRRDKRERFGLGFLVTAVVVVAAAYGIGLDGRAGSKGAERISAERARTAADSVAVSDWPGFGFSPGAGLRDQDDARLAGDLAAMATAGAGWIRLDVDWSLIEAEEGRYDWSEHDRLIDAATDAGLEVLGLLAYTPPWARPPETDSKHPPDDHQRFARFAAEAVTRYRPRGVGAWQVWNEPNSRLFWSTGADPERYGELLAATAAAIRSIDGEATIVSGGLAPALDQPEEGWLSPETYLDRLLRTGTLADVDAVGIHPYSFPARPLDRASAPWNTFLRLPALHDLLVGAEAGPEHLWITEYGAPTGGHERAVSEGLQATLLTDALEVSARWPWLGPTFLYTLRDYRRAEDDLEWNFGILRWDGGPKPAWHDVLAWSEARAGG